MTLDMLDAAFVTRWRAVTASSDAGSDDAPPAQDIPADAIPDDAPLVERLLRAAPDEWLGLAHHVERARHRGRRVIAVAGCERGEGRTTLVQCLATALRARGCEVTCVDAADAAGADGGAPGGGVPHDKRIVLVDAGIWFPPGPVRRQRLMVASLGCEAVILVRRADRPGIGLRAAILSGFGIEVLGEVMTFTPSAEGAPADPPSSPTDVSPTGPSLIRKSSTREAQR